MGAPKFNAMVRGMKAPADFLEALASEAPHKEVAAQVGITATAVRWRRKKMFPGRTWPNSRSARQRQACSCGGRTPRKSRAAPLGLEQIQAGLRNLLPEELRDLLLAVDARLLEIEVSEAVERTRRVVMDSQLKRASGAKR